jgi:peptidyl-prolyl cis-trans isomerase D
MAILNTIRKRTTVLIIVIGLALFSFVISGIFTSSTFQGQGGFTSSIAEVNGNPIPLEKFQQSLEIATRTYGSALSNTAMVSMVVEQEIRGELLDQQFDQLGLEVEGDQLLDYISASAYADVPEFQDEYGQFDRYKFKAAIAEWRATNPAQYDAWLNDEARFLQAAKERMYFTLVQAGITATNAEAATTFKVKNDKVSFEYLQLPYNSVADSLVKVSEADIKAHVSQFPERFKQDEERDLRYVHFKDLASEEDQQAVLASITELMTAAEEFDANTNKTLSRPSFAETDNVAEFLSRYSDVAYDSVPRPRNQLPVEHADSITSLAVGESYGPYKHGDTYKVSRLMDYNKYGSVRARHILVAYEGAERAASTVSRTKEEARAKARELLAKARGTEVAFAQLATEESDGPTASRGGDLGYFLNGDMVDAFNDYAFSNPIGAIGLVETSFGFHVVKVEDKRDVYQVATLVRNIEPSEATINKLYTDATTFEMKAKDSDWKQFPLIAQDMGYSFNPITKLKAFTENLPVLGSQRSIVKWAFDGQTKIGDIRRFDLADGYVIAQVVKQRKEGLQSPEDVSPLVIAQIRDQKKAALLLKQNAGQSWEAASALSQVQSGTASALSTDASVIPGIGTEPFVVGNALTLQEQGESQWLKGGQGIYKVRVTAKTPAMELPVIEPYARSIAEERVAQGSQSAYEALKKAAKIVDNRAIIY